MIVIRPYLEADWEAVCQVHDRAQPGEFAEVCVPRDLTPLAENPYLNKIFHPCRKFVACDAGQVVGFVALYKNYITLLYVHPDYQNKGVGKRLLRLALNIIGSPAWTVVIAANTRARHFYAKAGFQENGKFESLVSGSTCQFIRLVR
ncbi:MAG: GNAT family N-acetyltransferase [Cyanobacteriota bacterium]|nr:GNAT family N-acetyltransferase [Cyanobacteriota bacterium]